MRGPWCADGGIVLGLEKPLRREVKKGYGLVTTQMQNAPDPKAMMEVDHLGAALRPWLLRRPKGPSKLSDAFITPAESLGKIDKFRSKNHMCKDGCTDGSGEHLQGGRGRGSNPLDTQVPTSWMSTRLIRWSAIQVGVIKPAQTDVIVGFGAPGTPRFYGEKASRSNCSTLGP
ncbi:hypothetical protein BDN67DRAFT_984611 [Paxillus ammoniavirescens]|nr:hypothetical protein BDN67DRAFT_984611 [Paxillus ammoniavirescens]